MPSLSSFSDPKVYHILTYGTPLQVYAMQRIATFMLIAMPGTLLGSNIFQTFLNGPVAYKSLPRPNFSQLQQAIFPPFFAFHTALPIVLALSWPGEKIASVGGAIARQHAGWRGLLDEGNFWTGLAPIAVMFLTGLVNMVALGPMTTKIMRERKHQGKLRSRAGITTFIV